MRRLICIAVLAALSGCVTSRQITLPNGVQGLVINCPGAARDIGDCMNRAGKECGGPYQILTREGEVVSSAATTVGQSVFYTSGVKRTLIVQCGRAE